MEEQALEVCHRAIAQQTASSVPAQRVDTPQSRHRLYQRARELIAACYKEHRTLTELAAELETSIYHLCRVFRAGSGTSLHQYRDDLRLRCATDMILRGEDHLTEVALEVGYSSHSHLTSRFRRAFQKSPSDLRHTPHATRS